MFDIFFINKDDGLDTDFARLKSRFPWSKKVESIRVAQQNSTTRMFWVVWPGSIIDANFNFDYRPLHTSEEEYVHIWPADSETSTPSVGLFPKNRKYSARELEHRFFTGMVKMNNIASRPRGYDIVFISFNEENAERNYEILRQHPLAQYSHIHRIDGVKGIAAAHKAAANVATTTMFWIVDADAKVHLDFNFQFIVSEEEQDIVHVWSSKNPVTDLVYGHGGIKLLPRELTLNLDETITDVTTGISKRFKVMTAISNTEEFNVTPLSAWRTAFRECAKLASCMIPGQVDTETEQRLNAWVWQGADKPNGLYSKGGASAGEWFGKTYKDNPEMLRKINDYEWLAEEFKVHTKLYPPESFK